MIGVFIRECIERAVTLTKRSSTVPSNQCPICKSKTPKRSLNPCLAAARLSEIFEKIVRAYSDIKGGDEDWIVGAGVRGNDDYYTGGGQPLNNLSQLYPHPEKPNTNAKNSAPSQLRQAQVMMESDEEATQLGSNHEPSSPLLAADAGFLVDENSINTQYIEKLIGSNEPIDRVLAELESKLVPARPEVKLELEKVIKTEIKTELKIDFKTEDNTLAALDAIDFPSTLEIPDTLEHEGEKENNFNPEASINLKSCDEGINEIERPSTAKQSRKVKRPKAKTETKSSEESREPDLKRAKLTESVLVVTTSSIQSGEHLVQLARWSDKFNIPVLPDFSAADLKASILVLPTRSGFVVQKRTMKYFEALLLGLDQCKIISFDWITACLRSSRLLSNLPYSVKGDEVGLKDSLKNRNSAKMSAPSSLSLTQLFAAHRILIYGAFAQPPRDQMERLLIAAGATVLQSALELTSGSGMKSIVLSDPTTQVTYEQDAQIIRKYPIASPAWIFDCLSCSRVLDHRPYLIL